MICDWYLASSILERPSLFDETVCISVVSHDFLCFCVSGDCKERKSLPTTHVLDGSPTQRDVLQSGAEHSVSLESTLQ